MSELLETFKGIRGWGLGEAAFGDACSVDEKMLIQTVGEGKIDGMDKEASN